MASNDTGLKNTTIDAFCDVTHQFIIACTTVWPECNGMNEMKLLFEMTISNAVDKSTREKSKLNLITTWHDNMKPFYSLCAEKNPTMFTEYGDNIQLLKDCKIREKWLDSSVDDQTRECIWQYFTEMNRYAQMHCSLFTKIPSNCMSKIETTAMDLADKINSGTMTMGDLNLAEIGQSVVSGLSEQELQEFTQTVMGDMGMLQNLCSTMGGEMGVDHQTLMQSAGMVAGMMGNNGNGGNGNSSMTAMMQMMMGNSTANQPQKR